MGFRKVITIVDPLDPSVPVWCGEANLYGTWDEARASVREQVEKYLDAIHQGTHPWRSAPAEGAAPEGNPAAGPTEDLLLAHQQLIAERDQLKVQLVEAQAVAGSHAIELERVRKMRDEYRDELDALHPAPPSEAPAPPTP